MAKTRKHADSEEPGDELDILRKELQQLLDIAAGFVLPTEVDLTEGVDFFEEVAEFERGLIYAALEMAGGKLNEAARLLNMRPSTLSMKMKALHMRGRDMTDWQSEIH
jgi:DNA-binding NtrC family response regulator